MEFIRAHPYPAALAGAFLLVFLGTLVVYKRGEAPIAAAPSAWGGSGSLFDPQVIPNPDGTVGGQLDSGARDVPLYLYEPPVSADDEDAFDFDSFIASLSSSTQSPEPDTYGSEPVTVSYSFIPTGLISTTTPSPQRSALQESLYRYGNEVGEYIEVYESTHRNNATILRDQIEDRGNAQKASAVRSIGADLRALGESIRRIQGVPELFTYSHNALAEGYIEVGLKLSAIPDASGDQAFIAAINSYNAAADSFIKNYVAVATLFSVNGVRFAPTDAGSVFTFSGQ